MSALLSLMGWEPIDDSLISLFHKHKRVIITYPHTSCMDVWMYMLYHISTSQISPYMRVLVTPKVLARGGPIGRAVGAIAATEDGGVVDRICEQLSQMDKFIFFISPKGCITKSQWRTGYYHMAKKLDAWIVPGGFDFERKKFIHSSPFQIQDHETHQDITAKTQKALYHITPLHPMSSEFPIDAHTRPHNPCIMSAERWLILLIFVLIVVGLIVWFLRSRKSKEG
jgi:hypothetical protein